MKNLSRDPTKNPVPGDIFQHSYYVDFDVDLENCNTGKRLQYTMRVTFFTWFEEWVKEEPKVGPQTPRRPGSGSGGDVKTPGGGNQ